MPKKQPIPSKLLQNLPAGSHICTLYEHSEERLSLLQDFAFSGIKRGERVVIFACEGLQAELRASDVDTSGQLEAALEEGRLLFLSANGMGESALLEYLRTLAEEAVAGKFSGLRIAGEFASEAGFREDPERLVHFEIEVNRLVREKGCVLLCLYERSTDPGLLGDCLCAHTHVIHCGRLLQTRARAPERLPEPENLPALRLEAWLQSLAEAQAARERLARSQTDLEQLIEERTRDLLAEIEERRKMEAMLRESEASYRFLVENQMDLIVRIRPDGTLTYVNQAMCRYFGQEPEEMLGRSCLDYHEESSRAKLKTVLETIHERVVPDDPIFVIDHQVLDRQGKPAWQRWTNRGIFDETGKLVEIMSVGRDITSRIQHDLDIQEAQVEMEQRVVKRTLELMETNRQLQQEILERQRVEEALRESEERFSAFMRHLPGLAFIKDGQRRSVYVNERFEQYFGVKKEDWLGKTGDEHWPAEVAEGFARDDFYVLKEQKPITRIEMVEQEGEVHAYLTNKFPIYQPGKLPLLGGISIDITERYQAEQALRESEARFRWLVNSLDDIVFTMDRKGRWTAIYGRLYDKIGLLPEALIGKSIGEVLNPEQALPHLQKFERVLGGETLIYDWDYEGSGRKYHFQISAAPLRASEGQIIGVAGLWRDISAQKRAEIALRESEERFRLLYERAPLGYQSLDTQACIIDVNKTWQEMMGYTREEVCGRYFGEFMTPRSAEQLAECYARFLRVGEVYGAEFEMVRKDGSTFIASFNGKLSYDPTRGLKQSHCIMEDVTEKRRAEEQLKASLAEKEVMLREIHHRVKNNLQVMASLLSLQSESVADPAALAAFQESRQRIRSMALVHEELYQSRNLAQIDLENYLRKLTGYLHSAYRSSTKIEICLKAEAIPLSVEKAIPCGLIVNELVSNSMKYAFTEQESGMISISMQSKGELIELRVADNGIGLPAGLEIGNSETLGLQLVNILAGQLDGKLELEPGPGTAFRLIFPAN